MPFTYWDTRDRENSGIEIEAVANLARNWRLAFNLALPKAYQTNAYADTRAYLNEHGATLRQIVLDAGGLIDASNVATVDISIPANERSIDVETAADSWNNLQVARANIITRRQPIIRVSEVTANIYTDYTISSGFLRGLRLGGGVNYRGRTPIGYRGGDTIVDPNDPSKAIDNPAVSAVDPVYVRAYYIGTVSIGYTWKMKKGRALDFNLRIANVFDESRPVYYNTTQRPPGGDVNNPSRVATPTGFYYQTPRSYTLTTTFRF